MPTARAAPAGAALVAFAVLVLLAGCGAGAPPVRVGSGTDGESRLLAEIYAQGLEIRGVPVVRTGPVPAPLLAVRDGAADVVPARSGDLLRELDPGATQVGPDEVVQRVRALLPRPLAVMDTAPAQSTDAVVVPRGSGARTLADLAPRCATVVLGGVAAPPPGLERAYGCTPAGARPLDAGGPRTLEALRRGVVQAAVVRGTDPGIAAEDLTVLADPRSAFPAQNVVPLVDRSVLADGRAVEVLNKISAQLDTMVLTDLNRRIAEPGRPDPAQVVRAWLASSGVG